MIKISLQREPGGSPNCCSPRGGQQVIKIYNLRIEAYTSDVTGMLAGLLADQLVAECFKSSQLAQMQFPLGSACLLVKEMCVLNINAIFAKDKYNTADLNFFNNNKNLKVLFINLIF